MICADSADLLPSSLQDLQERAKVADRRAHLVGESRERSVLEEDMRDSVAQRPTLKQRWARMMVVADVP